MSDIPDRTGWVFVNHHCTLPKIVTSMDLNVLPTNVEGDIWICPECYARWEVTYKGNLMRSERGISWHDRIG